MHFLPSLLPNTFLEHQKTLFTAQLQWAMLSWCRKQLTLNLAGYECWVKMQFKLICPFKIDWEFWLQKNKPKNYKRLFMISINKTSGYHDTTFWKASLENLKNISGYFKCPQKIQKENPFMGSLGPKINVRFHPSITCCKYNK